MVKAEGRIERWWFSINLVFGPQPDLCGDFYGLSSIGLEDGKFNHVADVLRLDLVNHICETERAYIKLGEPANIDQILSDKASKR